MKPVLIVQGINAIREILVKKVFKGDTSMYAQHAINRFGHDTGGIGIAEVGATSEADKVFLGMSVNRKKCKEYDKAICDGGVSSHAESVLMDAPR